MDALNELESFSYQQGGPSAEPEPDDPPRKRARGPSAAQQAAALLAQAERELSESKVEVEAQIDANALKRMILSVEKRINENMQMRMKYSDRPEKFMDSELELYQELKALHCVAAVPELFPTFVKTRCASSLIGLLAHENADISLDVVDLFSEMCDSEDAAPEDLQATRGPAAALAARRPASGPPLPPRRKHPAISSALDLSDAPAPCPPARRSTPSRLRPRRSSRRCSSRTRPPR